MFEGMFMILEHPTVKHYVQPFHCTFKKRATLTSPPLFQNVCCVCVCVFYSLSLASLASMALVAT